MRATVDWKDGVRFEVTARGHRIVCDQPLEGGGSDQGMTPPEFMLASLGACAAYYAAEYLRARGLSREGLRVEIEAEKVQQPARLDGFRIVVEAPAAAEARHAEGIDRAVKRCLIHNTLLHAPSIAVAVEAPVTI
ncbi:MAG: OsmC family protein [Bryobacteraceae bacterium]